MLKYSEIEIHNSLGIGERYHGSSHSIVDEIRIRYQILSQKVYLRFAVKSMNGTMGPNGLVPSLLVYGIMPLKSAAKSSFPEQESRICALEEANREMAQIRAELKVRQELRKRFPIASCRSYLRRARL